MIDAVVLHVQLPPRLREELALLEILEEAAGEINAEEVMGHKRSTKLARFSADVYETLHWITAPGCRVNHPRFGERVRQMLQDRRSENGVQ